MTNNTASHENQDSSPLLTQQHQEFLQLLSQIQMEIKIMNELNPAKQENFIASLAQIDSHFQQLKKIFREFRDSIKLLQQERRQEGVALALSKLDEDDEGQQENDSSDAGKDENTISAGRIKSLNQEIDEWNNIRREMVDQMVSLSVRWKAIKEQKSMQMNSSNGSNNLPDML